MDSSLAIAALLLWMSERMDSSCRRGTKGSMLILALLPDSEWFPAQIVKNTKIRKNVHSHLYSSRTLESKLHHEGLWLQSFSSLEKGL
jgi:hypothetical protein